MENTTEQSKGKTESVKISVAYMNKVRNIKKETGIPLIRIIEKAIDNYNPPTVKQNGE